MKTFELFLSKYIKGREDLRELGVTNFSAKLIEANRNVDILLNDENKNELFEDQRNGFVKSWNTGRCGRMLTYYSLTSKGKKLIDKCIND